MPAASKRSARMRALVSDCRRTYSTSKALYRLLHVTVTHPTLARPRWAAFHWTRLGIHSAT